MHELSIAMSIVELAEEESSRRAGARIYAVHLKLGELSGVVKEALLSSWEMASAETEALKNSALVIEAVPVLVFCTRCQARRAVNSMQMFCCADCGTPTAQVLQGKEIEVVAMEIEECHSPV
jgi:hydrogenase nickel incorporation protein HypA/HybF